MSSEEIRKRFLDFFKARGHAIVPSSSLIPDDPSVLLTTAGMQQFKRYFTGELDARKDFGSLNMASVQKCFRTSDIDEVGDKTHLTFFEMLGHFSFGDYFKKETIEWTYQLLTEVFGISPERISAAVFAGNEAVPFDQESFDAWSRLLTKEKIRKGPRQDNFWGPAGSEGPCGACNEVYVDKVEVATLVFMEFYCNSDKTLKPLPKKGVDVGWGLERVVTILQGAPDIFETDVFAPLMSLLPKDMDIRTKRIVADHGRGIAFLISDGVRPSNKEAGYILRRLMRRVIVYSSDFDFRKLFEIVVHEYSRVYPELKFAIIKSVFDEEKQNFERTLKNGLKELEKIHVIDALSAFKLYESFGLPYEIIKERGGEKAAALTREGFDAEFKKHQEISKRGQEKKFGGHGLILNTGELKAGNEEELKKVLRLHTTTHLLQAALRKVLGDEAQQRGSDITPERTRFDFSFPRKLTPEEIKNVEALVNEKIKEDLPVSFQEMSKAGAEKTGALYFFKEKYPERVKVYYVGRSLEDAWSKEFCGGPHVAHTGEIGTFKIAKEEAVGAGVRRIRATVA